MPKKPAIDWEKRLSPTAKAEMLAATLHFLTDHQPEVWKTVPEWLRARIRQAMHDCSIAAHDLTKEEMLLCVEYGKWLDKKHPQKKPKKKRYLHYAFISKSALGQYGCAWGTSLADVKRNSDPREHGDLVRMPQKQCKVCKESER